jgi:hypothetical protein
MAGAICFKCGAEKSGALTQCGSCNVTPRDEHDLALSLVLSEHLSSKTQLQVLAHEIQSHLKLTVPESLLNQAREALKDPQLLAMLGVNSKKANGESQVRTAPTATRSEPQSTTNSSPRQRKRRLYQSDLQKNPFAFLGVTTRDDRRRIVELAEEKSLELDHDACQKARSDLTSPRTRLSVEMSWFPGVSPRKAEQYLSTLHADPMSIREESGVPTLAHLNLLAAVFEAVDGNDSAEDVADFIQEMAYLVDDLSAEQVLRDINEDRAVSGFPEVKGVDQVEAELSERKRHYRNAIKDALNRLSPASLVEAMTAAVDQITYGGEEHAPELIDDLVDSYAVETQGFLQKEAESVEKLIQAARNSAKSGEKAVKPIVDKLVVVARNWDNVAQPIQLSAKARGIDHDPSNEIAYSIRSLAIDLFNEHDMLAQSQRLTELLQELFAELPEVVERVDEDAEALADIFHNRAQDEAQKREWERDITFRAEVGVMFKDVLSISPEGVAWKNQRFPLDAITRVRWGAVRHSVNGIPTGTSYTLAFGDSRSEAVVELKKESTYSGFLEKLWKAVVIRLLTELFETLQAGKEIRFGEATLSDDGITLIKHKFLGANEKVRCTWGQVHVWSADGSFYIGAKDDKKTYVGLSYMDAANTHVLEAAIRMAFKKPGMCRLSDMLR